MTRIRALVVALVAPRAATLAAVLAATLAASVVAGCAAAGSSDETGWQPLFDGGSTQAWRGYRQPGFPAGWQVVEGALTRVGPAGDLVTTEQYGDFELEFEWRVAPGGNSGVMFHVTEDHDAPWETGPEYQILDDEAHRDGLDPRTSAGANYALHAPEDDATRPAGEWNEARLVVRGPHVEHWLNGTRLLEYELWSDDWRQRVAASKFGAMPDYGTRPRGHIVLQDHGDRVAYRDIRVRVRP